MLGERPRQPTRRLRRNTGVRTLFALFFGIAGMFVAGAALDVPVVHAGPPPHAGPRAGSRRGGPPPYAPGSPSTDTSVPPGGPPGADEHAGHHETGPEDAEVFLPGTTLPRLVSGDALPPATRQLLRARADESVSQGRAELAAGLRRLADAPAGDSDALASAIAQVRQGSRELSKGVALRRSLAQPSTAAETTLEWFRQDLGLRRSTATDSQGGLGVFHLGVMAILVAFAGAMLWMYFFKMRRAAALLQTLEASAPAPGRRVVEQPTRASTWRGELKVAAVFRETETVKTFRLCHPDASPIPFTYLPGQFLTVKVAPSGKTVQRSYTIASSPTQGDYVEITVKRESEGIASRFLHDQVSPGDTLTVSAPAGRFTFTGKEADAVVLIAGGVGITPMMSIARYLTDRVWGGAIHLLACCKREEDIIFARELETLAQRYETFRYTAVLSSPGDGWTGIRGRLTKETVLELIPDVAKHRVHVCGPLPMMDAVASMLEEIGVPTDQIRTEKFGPATPRPKPVTKPDPSKAENKHLPVVAFRASGKKGALGPGVTILDAAETAGVEIDNSCRVGTCGSCVVRLLKGEVTMEVEDGLHPDDKADGLVLACQACAKADIVVDA